MNVLLLTPRYPHFVNGGGLVKTSKIIEYLAETFDLKIFSLSTKITHKKNDRNIIEFPLKQVIFEPSLMNILKSYIKNVPLSVYRNYNYGSLECLDELFDWSDAVIVDHFFMYHYIPDDFQKPVYLHQHNAEFKIWERTAVVETNYIKKLFLYFESLRVKAYEKNICQKAKVVFASPNDIECLSSLGLPDVNFIDTYHLGDDSLLKYPISDFSQLDNNLTFIGNLNWKPNLDGIYWFLDKIWPKVLKDTSNAKLNIIGMVSLQDKSKLERYDNVVVYGFVGDLNEVLKDTKIFISPLRFGSGMKVKNITALYKGLPVITTDIGAEGIELEHNINAIISNDESDFAKNVCELLHDHEKCMRLACSARKLALRKYSWDENINKIIREIKNDD